MTSSSVSMSGVPFGKQWQLPFDGVLLMTVLLLLTVGTVCMTSASTEIADGNYRNEFFSSKASFGVFDGRYACCAFHFGYPNAFVSGDELVGFGHWLCLAGACFSTGHWS